MNPFVFESSPKVARAVPFIAGRSHLGNCRQQINAAHSQSTRMHNNYALRDKGVVFECASVRPFLLLTREREKSDISLALCRKNHTGCGKRYTVRADSCIVMINFTSINSLMVVWNKINIACRCWRAAAAASAGCGEIPTAARAHLPWISFSKDNFTVIRIRVLAGADKFFNSHHGYERLAFLIGV